MRVHACYPVMIDRPWSSGEYVIIWGHLTSSCLADMDTRPWSQPAPVRPLPLSPEFEPQAGAHVGRAPLPRQLAVVCVQSRVQTHCRCRAILECYTVSLRGPQALPWSMGAHCMTTVTPSWRLLFIYALCIDDTVPEDGMQPEWDCWILAWGSGAAAHHSSHAG